MKNLTLLVYCKLRAFLADEEGANAIEYAVIAGLIAVALIAVLSPTDSGIVGGLKAFFDGVGEKSAGWLRQRTDASAFPVASHSGAIFMAPLFCLCNGTVLQSLPFRRWIMAFPRKLPTWWPGLPALLEAFARTHRSCFARCRLPRKSFSPPRWW